MLLDLKGFLGSGSGEFILFAGGHFCDGLTNPRGTRYNQPFGTDGLFHSEKRVPTVPKPTKKHIAAAKISKLELIQAHERWMKRWDFATLVFPKLIWPTVICFCVYFGVYASLRDTAGQETIINYVVSVVGELAIDRWIYYVVIGSEAAYIVALRRKLTSERGAKDARIEELERRLDPQRKSSNLSVDGETHHSDRESK